MARTSEERTIDRLLILYLINQCFQKHHLHGLSETKLQKLVFLTEKELVDKKYKAFNYSFIKLLYPTYSSELRNDLTYLIENNFLKERWFKQTIKNKLILEDFSSLFERNRPLISMIDEVLAEHAKTPTDKLVNQVFNMRWKNDKTIEDLNLKTPLLYPLRTERANRVFEITEDELEDLMINLDPRLSNGLNKALDEMKRGRLLTHEEVFGKL